MKREEIRVVLSGKVHTVQYSRGNGNSAANCRSCGLFGHEQIIGVHKITCEGAELLPRGLRFRTAVILFKSLMFDQQGLCSGNKCEAKLLADIRSKAVEGSV
jgi:hypothetical protein